MRISQTLFEYNLCARFACFVLLPMYNNGFVPRCAMICCYHLASPLFDVFLLLLLHNRKPLSINIFVTKVLK